MQMLSSVAFLLLLGLPTSDAAIAPLVGKAEAGDMQSFTLDRSVLGNLRNTSSVTMAVVPTGLSENFALVAELSIGSPAQKLRCLLDTGSSDLWVPSKRCRQCGTQRTFDADASDSFAPDMMQTNLGQRPKKVDISYGSGEIVGYSVRDTIALGSVQVESQAFVIVEDAALPSSKAWDGICGLGWRGLAKTGPALYERFQDQGVRAIFAFVPGQRGETPYLALGEMPNEEAMKPDSLAWAKAESMGSQFRGHSSDRGFWLVSGGLAITKKEPTPARFLVDTGTNQVLLAPPRYYNAFMRSLLPPRTFDEQCGMDPRAGNLVVCDCSIKQQAGMPPLRIYLGGKQFVLAVEDLFRRVPASDGGELCMLQIQPNGNMPASGTPIGEGDVLGGLLGGLLGGGMGAQPGGAGGGDRISEDPALAGLLGSLMGRRLQLGEPMVADDPMEDVWMIGGVFLEHFVTIFDFDEGRVGFAEPSEGVSPLRPSTLDEVAGSGGASFVGSLSEAHVHSVIALASEVVAIGLACSLLVGLLWRGDHCQRKPRGGGEFVRSEFEEVSPEEGIESGGAHFLDISSP